jgi:hypothetical protein
MTLKELMEKYENAEDYIIDELDKIVSPEIIDSITNSIMANSFSLEEVMEAVSKMKNMDGTTGEHWSLDETNDVLKKYELEFDEYDYYYTLNMLYSDNCNIFKDDLSIYIKLAENWLNDEDVPPFKAKRYYNYVVSNK